MYLSLAAIDCSLAAKESRQWNTGIRMVKHSARKPRFCYKLWADLQALKCSPSQVHGSESTPTFWEVDLVSYRFWLLFYGHHEIPWSSEINQRKDMSLRPLDATTKDISPLRTCKFKELRGACLGDPHLWRGHMSGRFLESWNGGNIEIR